MVDLLILIPNKVRCETGVNKVSTNFIEIFKSKKNFTFKEINISNSIKKSIFKDFKSLLRYLFIGFFDKEFQKTKILFSTTSRLPIFGLKKDLFKIIFVHDLIYIKQPKTMRKFSFIADVFFIPNSIKRSDLIICASKSTYNDIKKYFPKYINKVNIIPLASPLENVKPPKKYKSIPNKYILCVGTIEPRKNYINILKAYSKLSKDIRNKYPLLIIGNKGWGNIDIFKEIKDLNIKENIIIKDYVSDKYLKKIYENAYCLLYPSLFEGFGFPIIEAHSLGVPSIISNNSAMPEVGEKGSLLVNPNSSNSILFALKKIILSKSLRNNLSQKAIENAKNYSWEKVSEDFFKVLRNQRLIFK